MTAAMPGMPNPGVENSRKRPNIPIAMRSPDRVGPVKKRATSSAQFVSTFVTVASAKPNCSRSSDREFALPSATPHRRASSSVSVTNLSFAVIPGISNVASTIASARAPSRSLASAVARITPRM